MSIGKIKQQALSLEDMSKRDVRTQFGALPWRRHNGEVQVCLVTSKRTRRWIVPKGWPQDGATPAEAAEREAWEEAGLVGKIKTVCLGIFSYSKDIDADLTLPCIVALFPLKVQEAAANWPEKRLRARRWVTPEKAAKLVDEPELAAILRKFDPDAV